MGMPLLLRRKFGKNVGVTSSKSERAIPEKHAEQKEDNSPLTSVLSLGSWADGLEETRLRTFHLHDDVQV